MFSHNSTTKSHTSTNISREVVLATGDIAYQFQGKKFKGKDHQTDMCCIRKSAIGTGTSTNFELDILMEQEDPY